MSPEHSIDIFLGLDIGKSGYHACALDRDGNKIFDKPLPQLESELAAVSHQPQQHGTILVVVDQPNTIGALPIAVARECGCEVGYLPGLAMHKAADLYPGRAKTDKRDAFIIADTARTMPHTLRAVDQNNEVLSELKCYTASIRTSPVIAPAPLTGYAASLPRSTQVWNAFLLVAPCPALPS